jgi:hypothetical protein
MGLYDALVVEPPIFLKMLGFPCSLMDFRGFFVDIASTNLRCREPHLFQTKRYIYVFPNIKYKVFFFLNKKIILPYNAITKVHVWTRI